LTTELVGTTVPHGLIFICCSLRCRWAWPRL